MSAYSIVYLAEKHSIAEALADVLPGRSVKRNGYIECGSAAVTWLSGHLLEQAPPEVYDPAYKRWSRETLPIVPEVFKYTVRRDRNIPKQLAVIKNLLRESPSAVNAADFDREGQLLVDEVLELVRYKGQVLRLKTRALDRTSLTRELGRMAPDGEFAGMRDAARARSELDWLAGMNLTRAMTIHGRSVSPSGVLSLGRVQTPTLALVVERDETIENFVPKTFYKVSCPFTAAAGTFVTLLNPKPDMEGLDEEKRLVDKKTALAVRDAVSFRDGTVTGVETQRRADPAPLPYSLTDIQKEASALYGMGASAVLDCCQELYEARFTSYPRTDCRYLPFEQFGEARDVLAAIGHLPGMEAMLAAADPERRGACWNTARVTAHHAIIPTAVPARGLSEPQEKIYRLICRRYVWQFLPPHIYKKTRIDVSCAGYDWRADGRTEVSPGWYAFRKAGLSGGTKEKETKEPEPAPLPHVEKGEAVRAGQAKVDEGQTTPPARFTEGTLVEAMENIQRYLRGASGEDRDILRKTEGLGTVATRATIISTLLKRGYLAKKGRSLLSTPTGRSLIHICPQSIRDPLMTADMERSLTEIQKGRIPYKNYVASYAAKLPELISEIFGTPADGFAADPGTLCPRCGKPLKRVRGKTGRWFWLCTGRPDCTYAAADSSGRPGRAFPPKDSAEKDAPAQEPEGPLCPRCGKHSLVRRQGPKGPFWGCSGFPHCRFTCGDKDGGPALPEGSQTQKKTSHRTVREKAEEPQVRSVPWDETLPDSSVPLGKEGDLQDTEGAEAGAKRPRRKAASGAQKNGQNACPRCGRELVLRKGPKGPFWGCSGFPRCRFTCSDRNGSPDLAEDTPAPKRTRRRTVRKPAEAQPQAAPWEETPSVSPTEEKEGPGTAGSFQPDRAEAGPERPRHKNASGTQESGQNACPLCGRPLARRQGTRGFFWGCTGYPGCRFTCEDRDGTPVRPEEAPVCPECGAPLRQVAIRKGPHAGSMAWLCSNDGGHASGRSRFFEDRDGKPVLS